MSTMTEAAQLTRAEAAYAHLASFRRDDRVDVGCRYGAFHRPGSVTTPQQHDHADINRAYLVASIDGAEVRITVGSLLSGRHTITGES